MKKIVRSYNFSDAILLSVARLLKQYVTRDGKAFATYGYPAATTAALQKRITAFEEMATDTELEQFQAEATQLKTAKETALKQAIREITNRARLLLGEDSPKYKRFGCKGLDNMKNADLSVCGKRTADVATDLLAELAVRGVTQEMINEVLAAKIAFDDAVSAQGKQMSERGIFTDERIAKANDLYALTVELADAGKSIWSGKSDSKYRDYVLYTETGSPVATPEPVEQA